MRRGGMSKQPRQKRAEIQRLSSISNLRTKQLAGSVLSKNAYAQQEAERIEHFDIELRPTKLHELKMGEVVAGNESMVAGFLDAISKVRQLSFNDDDDLYDRLSRRYTVVMLTLFAVIISTKQYVGDPIACWTPAQFTGAHVEYTNYICWISNKYYVDFKRRLPGREEIREHKIAYYQWVPFILLTMMLFFYVPNTIWKFLAVQSGFDIASWVKLLNSMEALHPLARQKTVRHVANLILRSLYSTGSESNLYKVTSRVRGSVSMKSVINDIPHPKNHYLITNRVAYVIKILYIGNVIGQLYLLQYFIDERYGTYGIDVVQRVVKGGDWELKVRFPRVTYCDFTIRNMGDNMHQHTVQCVLPINLFNEKIFIIIWFWYAFILIASCFGFFKFIWLLLPWNRYKYMSRLLSVIRKNKFDLAHTKHLQTFTDSYLGKEGFLLIRLVTINTNDLTGGEVASVLWDNFWKTDENKTNV
ncbi:hypothetical protein ACOME3_007152 [Neoechinorhynchus agilis]